MLSCGGIKVLINSVLLSFPMHVLSTIVPHICVLKELHRILAKFFRQLKLWRKVSIGLLGENCAYPSMREDLALDICFTCLKLCKQNFYGSLELKIQYRKKFMGNKYWKNQIPSLVQWKGALQLWNHIFINRDICLLSI